MAIDPATHCTLLDELDARQNAVLADLDALNQRVEGLLQQFTGSAAPRPEPLSGESTGATPAVALTIAATPEKAA